MMKGLGCLVVRGCVCLCPSPRTMEFWFCACVSVSCPVLLLRQCACLLGGLLACLPACPSACLVALPADGLDLGWDDVRPCSTGPGNSGPAARETSGSGGNRQD